MSMKKIIPCLDIKMGRVVKGTNFVNLRDAGDPVEFAAYYDRSGADELVFLDITASVEGRKCMVEVARRTAKAVSIPFIVGGGLSSVEDISEILSAGADKASLNTAAFNNPALVREAAQRFGSPSIVVAIDAKKNEEGFFEVYTHGGLRATGKDAVLWAKEAAALGAGEILVTSMDRDGVKNGYDIELTAAIAQSVDIPVIASGGVGSMEHIYEGLTAGRAAGALAASVFHFQEFSVAEVKDYLLERGVAVRPFIPAFPRLQFGRDRLIPAIAQDAESKTVLMMAWMNEEALKLTLETGYAHYFSRARARIWKKGETSGHVQKVREVFHDCDADTLLLIVEQSGAACHEGSFSCFTYPLRPGTGE